MIAQDGANGYQKDRPNQNSIYLDIKVIDVNDNPPVFGAPSYSFSVAETALPDYVIGRIEVTDEDTETFFNYSISDSTFGIRGIFDQSRSKINNYRGSAEIYLNNFLDFKIKSSYNLTVFVSDSQFLSQTTVIVNVLTANDRAPVFIVNNNLAFNAPYIVHYQESTVPPTGTPLVTVNDFLVLK